MKRKETEWVNPLIHRPDSVYIFPQKQSYHNKFSDITLLQRSQRSMQECRKNQQNWLTCSTDQTQPNGE